MAVKMAAKRILFLLTMLALLPGCTVSWNGHKIPLQALDHFEAGKTTPAQVEAALGPPEDMLVKPLENIVVYVYRSVFQATTGFGAFGIGAFRSKQNGYTVNVTFKNDVLFSYEFTLLKQKILKRKKT